MTNAIEEAKTTNSLFQRAGAFLKAMAYSDIDYTYETMDHFRSEQDALRSQVAELKALVS